MGETAMVAGPSASPSFLDSLAGFLNELADTRPLGVAVSGGGDSLSLLLALNHLVPAQRLFVLTVDHGLRPDSTSEARTVAVLCASRAIPHETLAWSGPKPATRLQARARQARYELLAEAAGRLGLCGVVTAHTRDDQAETLWMRQARTTDHLSTGLAGIPPATLYDGRLWVMRPLLDIPRRAVRDWLSDQGVKPMEDPGNADLRFERVRVRRDLAANPAPVGLHDAKAAQDRRQALAAACAGVIADRTRRDGQGTIHFRHAGVAAAPALAVLVRLVDLVGGRARPLDRHGKDLLRGLLETGVRRTATVGRVLIDVRDGAMRLSRENRALPRVLLAPGATTDWDGRFRIANRSLEPIAVSAGPGPGRRPELLCVERTGEAAEHARSQQPPEATVSALCGAASRILPVFEYECAVETARLAEAPQFPPCPWRRSAKVVRF